MSIRERKRPSAPSALFLAGVVVAVTSVAAAAQQERRSPGGASQDWRTYVEPDTGTAIDYPAGIFTAARESTNERLGRTFLTDDGRAWLAVFGRDNPERDSPSRYVKRNVDFRAAKFSYVRVTPRFFVASGTRAGAIFYRRCNFRASHRALDCFHVQYPAREKRAWDPIVTRLSFSLRSSAR
jgi:hypothetical protein